jgi:hypothetical protein
MGSRAPVFWVLFVLPLILAPVGFAFAQDEGPYPAVPCEDPGPDLSRAGKKTCACKSVPLGVCAYDADPSCSHDTLLCREDACADVLGAHPVSVRCENVDTDRTDVPNVLLVFADDANWVFQGDVNNAAGEHYSPWDEYYKKLACHGGSEPGSICRTSSQCSGGGAACLPWTERCEGGASHGDPCAGNDDCGVGAECVPCAPGECRTNPMQTPALDRLAEAGAYFPVAHTTSSVCAPSLMSVLTGLYPNDFRPRSLPITDATIPRLLGETHCSLSIGKTWVKNYEQSESCYDCCCEEAGCCDDLASCPASCSPSRCCGDPHTGLHYSIQTDFSEPLNFTNFGRKIRSMERGACFTRQINQEGRAFFTWLAPYVPHDPRGAPGPIRRCYTDAAGSGMTLVSGRPDSIPPKDYLGRISWFDCILGSYMDFLETTPDTRFCPHPGGHTPEAHGCGPCTRTCDAATPCGNGVACVDGRCQSDVPCLIDTTVILYFNDNGSDIVASKGNFTENGYRTPLILAYRGGLGSYDGAALAELPAPVEPSIYPDRLAHTLDLLPTIVDYAGGDPESATRPGRSLRTLVEDGDVAPWRSYLFGHRSTLNRNVWGDTPHYVRGPTMIAPDVPGTTGAGSCSTDQDCADQGWTGPGLALDRCVNGVCTRACERGTDCTVAGLGTASCTNGYCATANACKLYHDPFGCKQSLYNLAQDPSEERDLLESRLRRTADPLAVCFDPRDGSRGAAMYEELSCELTRWCLEDCKTNPDLRCERCCATRLCDECEPVPCSPCLADGSCNRLGNQCWDCRRPCGSDPDCSDLSVTCDTVTGRCAAS